MLEGLYRTSHPMSPIFFAKHFSQLARAIGKSQLRDEQLEILLVELGKLFAMDNERFSFERFKRAVWRARQDGGH